MIWTKEAQSAKLQIFDCSRKISPNLYFDRLLLLKVNKISAKKVQRRYVSRYWRVMQNLKKYWFVVSKITKTWWISTQTLKSLKLFNFLPKKSTEELSFMTLKRDVKSEEKLTCGLKNDISNLVNFHQSTRNRQNWDSDGILLSKVEDVWT